MPDSTAWASMPEAWRAAIGLLCVAARAGAAFVLVPIPGLRSAPAMSKAVLIIAFSAAAYPLLPPDFTPPLSLGSLLIMLAAEITAGLGAAVIIGFLNEVFSFAMQSLAMQAGYAYASAIDPNTQADSGVLLVIAQLGANLLFFATGMHLLVFRAFARSLEQAPPGTLLVSGQDAEAIVAFGGMVLEFGLRLALPVMGVLFLTDVTLALLGRIQPNLQLLTLIFPLKMLVGLLMLAALAGVMPLLYRRLAASAMEALGGMLR